MASVKAQIVIGFDNVDTEWPPLLQGLVIDGVPRTITPVPSGAVAANWEFNIGATDIDTADNFNSMLLSNSSNYTVSTVPTSTGAKCTINANNWGDNWNFGSPSVVPTGLGLSIVSQRDNNVDPISIAGIVTNNKCYGTATGVINVVVSGGAYPFTYAWADGPTTGDRSGLAAGDYTITVTDSLGNQSTKTFTITEPQALSITASITDATGGGSNGAIDVTVSGGTGPYTYAWADGPTTEDRSGLAAGTYTVTVTDADGCTNTASFTVNNADSAITISTSVTNVTCNGGSDGAINITVSGGTGPYTYAWSDGPTTEDRSGLVAGTYTVVVTDSTGDVNSATITVTEPDAISVVAQVSGADIVLTVTGGTTPYTYLWSTGETTKDITVTTEGDYSVTVADANGCTKQVVVTVPPFRFYWSDNPIELALTASDLGSKPNLSFVCEVYIEDTYLSNSYTKVIELEQPADDLGSTVFDVQDIVAAWLEPTLPAYGDTSVALADGHFRRFYLRYAEKYGDPPVVGTYTQESVFYVLLGGLNRIEFATDNFFENYLPNTKPFYTWEPTTRQVYTDTQHYLHFMVNGFSLSAVELWARCYYDDNTSVSQQVANVISSPNRFEVYRLPAGFGQLDLGSINAAKTMTKYELWVEDGAGNVISEVRTFELVERPTWAREFIYLNSVGGWNTLIAEGEIKESAEVVATELRQRLESGYRTTESEINVVRKVAQRRRRVRGGYIANGLAEYLIDFAMAIRVYAIEDGRFVPVRIDYNPELVNEVDGYVTIDFDVIPDLERRYTPYLG